MNETLRKIPYNETPGASTERPSLGQRILIQREIIGISQLQLANEAGISQGYVSQLENGDSENPSYKTAIGIARALGTGAALLEDIPDNKVFLMPQARRLFQIISSPGLDDKKKVAVITTAKRLIPETRPSDKLKYVDGELLDEKSIGQIIRDARGVMPQWELAKRSATSQGYVSNIEGGLIGSPTLSVFTRISETLHVDVYELLGLEKKVYPQEIEQFDRFLRSSEFTREQKAVFVNKFIGVLSLILQGSKDDLKRISQIFGKAADQ